MVRVLALVDCGVACSELGTVSSGRKEVSELGTVSSARKEVGVAKVPIAGVG